LAYYGEIGKVEITVCKVLAKKKKENEPSELEGRRRRRMGVRELLKIRARKRQFLSWQRVRAGQPMGSGSHDWTLEKGGNGSKRPGNRRHVTRTGHTAGDDWRGVSNTFSGKEQKNQVTKKEGKVPQYGISQRD